MDYIRVKKDGFILPYSPTLEANPGCEVVTEEEAFPELFVKKEIVEKVKKVRAKRSYSLDLGTEDLPLEPEYSNQDINLDASRKLP